MIGEIDLFKSPTDRDRRILLDRSSTGTIQQYTVHLDFVYRFAGLAIYCQADPGPNPLLGPLAKVLESHPDLLHQAKLASGWAELIKSAVPEGSELIERVNADYVAWNFQNRADLFVQRFGMVTIVPGRRVYYMFSKVDVTPALSDPEETELGLTAA